MPDPSPQSRAPDAERPAAAPVDAPSAPFAPDDDLALGCECANPALQIERWWQEALPAPPQHAG